MGESDVVSDFFVDEDVELDTGFDTGDDTGVVGRNKGPLGTKTVVGEAAGASSDASMWL